MNAPNGHERGKTETIVISGIIFASFEGLGLLLSDNSSGFSGYGLVVVHMVAGWCFIAGPFGAWHELLKRPFAEKFKRIWLSYFGVCVLVSTLVFFIWRPEYPSINLKLVTSHAPNNILDLSNCRLPSSYEEEFSWLPTDRDILIIPLSSDESDVGMLFQVLSSDEIDNLEVFIALPQQANFKMEDGWTHNINVSGLASKKFSLKQVNSIFQEYSCKPSQSYGVTLPLDSKAPGDWRTPKAGAKYLRPSLSLASWTAAVLRRFHCGPSRTMFLCVDSKTVPPHLCWNYSNPGCGCFHLR